jgi:hypothetical protein
MGQRANTRGGAYPQAPTQEEWERMGPEEQARVVEALPGEVTYEEMAMPEGDRHSRPKVKVRDALDRLPTATARKYERQQARQGRYESRVLGLEFELVDDTLRLWAGNALLLESAEMLEQVRESLEKVQQRAEQEARQRQGLELRLAEEAKLRAEAEQRLAELQSRLERLQQREE